MFLIIITLLFIGLFMWAILTYAPIAQPWRNLLILVVLLLTLLWLYGAITGHRVIPV